ncbi:hypothetical protein ACLB1M_09260 [Escherichia coli]
MAIAAWDRFTGVGPAEGERHRSGDCLPSLRAKSNAVNTAFKAALADAGRSDYDAPVYLRNVLMKLMKEMGYGQEYRYVMMSNAYAAGEVYFRWNSNNTLLFPDKQGP